MNYQSPGAMINAQTMPAEGPSSLVTNGKPVNGPLTIRCEDLNSGLRLLNEKLAAVRGQLFGEGESAGTRAPDAVSVGGALANAQDSVQEALGQLDTILDRI
jgi:hypothetical protein